MGTLSILRLVKIQILTQPVMRLRVPKKKRLGIKDLPLWHQDSNQVLSNFFVSQDSQTCPHKTTDGKCCSIPFTYKGIRHNSCTTADHNRLWCSLDPTYSGKWGNCSK